MQNQTFVQKTYVQVLLTLILVGVIAALSAYSYLTFKQVGGVYAGEATISVTGEGEVMAVPDVGSFSFGVRGEGEDAVTAQANSATSIAAIVAYLTEAEVAETDIKTENYSLNPRYRFEERVCLSNNFCPPGEQIIDGFEVYQTITVKVRDLDQTGTLIAGVGQRGATDISSLQFTIDDESSLMAQARTEAIEDAKAQAHALAKDLGMELGNLTGFFEEKNQPMYYGNDMYSRNFAMDDKAMEAATLPTGENAIKSVVTIMYELK